MIEKLLMKLRLRDDVSAEEERALRAIPHAPVKIPRRTTFVRAGQVLDASTLLLDGLMCRYKDMRNGSRQISELHVPGDFADLHSLTLKRLDHNIITMSECTAVAFPHKGLRELTENYPHLTRVLWFSTNLDAAIHREWVLSLGRRTAIARVAQFFCEVYIRLEIVGLAKGGEYALDFTQIDLAECTGLTPVHVNRTLRALREQGLAEFRSGQVRITDLAQLKRCAEFDDTYLSLEKRPR
jgi:CRP-like cAMP-binding protein